MVVCLFFVCVFSEASAIENAIGSEVTASVASNDLYWSSVEVSGQSVVLTGSAPDAQARLAAERRAAGVAGVSGVENQIEVIGEAGSCQEQIDTYLRKERMTFKPGKAEIADSSMHMLGMLAMIVRTCPNPMEIAAHTDGQGDAEINLALSQRRADVVARHLVRHGVMPQKIRAVGYGESQPVGDNATEDGRRDNRRIELRVLGEVS